MSRSAGKDGRETRRSSELRDVLHSNRRRAYSVVGGTSGSLTLNVVTLRAPLDQAGFEGTDAELDELVEEVGGVRAVPSTYPSGWPPAAFSNRTSPSSSSATGSQPCSR